MNNLDIEQNCGDNIIVKTYPNSGQKKVYLVKDNDGVLRVVKIVSKGNERVLREIETVTENNIPNVPEIYEVKEEDE